MLARWEEERWRIEVMVDVGWEGMKGWIVGNVDMSSMLIVDR